MNVIERNNVKLQGSGGHPVMFAHGFGCDQQAWRLVEPAFRADYQTILFDHVGAGNSDLSAYDRVKYSTLHGYADDVIRICEELDLRDLLFVGHSVSATIGVLAAIRRPEFFRGLVLVCPNPCFVDEPGYQGGFTAEGIHELLRSLESNYEAWSRAMAPLIMGNMERHELGAELADSFCRARPEIATHFAEVTFLSDHRREFAALRLPTLILQTREDSIAPPSVGAYVAGLIPESELTLMRARGHCPHISAPEETIAAIEASFRPQRPLSSAGTGVGAGSCAWVSAPPAR